MILLHERNYFDAPGYGKIREFSLPSPRLFPIMILSPKV